MTDAVFVYVTCPDTETAERIARDAVGARFAACANILPAHQSFYWWDGEIQKAKEVALILKTCADLYSALEGAVKAAHPYECPCIVALPIEQGFGPYLDWIKAETV